MSKLFESIKKIFGKPGNSKQSFTFPYSTDPLEKRGQLWENLQKGILLEENGTFIPWASTYDILENYKENKKIRADRLEWNLGTRVILDGYPCQIEITKWLWKTTDAITLIDENLGTDDEGMAKFNYLKAYITGLLGNPVKESIEKFGSFDIGELRWENGIVVISLNGIEKSSCRYSFRINLANA